MKKALKISLIVIGAIFVLLLLVNFLAGPIAKNYVQKHDKELIGREMSIGKLSANIITGKLKINDLTLFEDNGITPFVSFERFETKIRWRDLFNHNLWVKQATLSGLNVNLEQNRDWFNFNSLLDQFASDSTKKESTGFGMVINDIQLEKGDIHYVDLALGNELFLRDIAVHIPFIDLSEMKTDVGLDLSLSDNATLHTDLHFSDDGKKYFIDLKMKNLGVEVIEPYLQQYYPVDLLQGLADLDMEVEGLTDHVMDFNMKGNLTLNEMVLQDTIGNPLGSIDSVFAEVSRFNLNNKIIDLDYLYLSGLNAEYIVKADSTSNFDLVLESYFHSDSTAMEPGSDSILMDTEEHKSWQYSIADMVLKQSEVVYENNDLPQPFHYEISDIQLTAKDFTRHGDNAIQMNAVLNKFGKLHLDWRGRFQGLDNQNLTLMLSNVKVADFSPYIMQMFGFPVESGTMSFRSQNIIANGNINGINKLQIAAPKLGDKIKYYKPQFDKVPLKLGLYLLSDKHNNVVLNLPVSGNLNNPAFSYGKALGKVFSNLLTKAAASPFRLMTDEDNNLKYIPFDPLQFDFSPEQYVMIDNVVTTLQSRSDLGIVLEEQVQYEEVIKQLSIMQLQRDYYLSTHPETKASDIDFLTNETIRSIKLTDKGLCDFAAQYSKKKKLHSAKEVTSVACEVYRSKSEAILPRLMSRRNEMLTNYLHNVKGLSPEQISVTTIDASLMKSFIKPSRFEMHVFTYEEME